MPIATSYSVDNDRKFTRALNALAALTDDLTIPLTLISKDFYRSEQAIFNLKGPGRFPDLALSTKAHKKRAGKPVYPILVFSGKLKKSMTEPNSEGSINEIINNKTLVIGTRIPYGIFHQEGTKKMPMRKFLFIGPEAPTFADDDQKGRLERWLGIINGYIDQVKQRSGF